MGRNKKKETRDFNKLYEDKCQTGASYQDAYEMAENEWEDRNGERKYKNIGSFKSTRSQITTRDRSRRKS